jgi:hypothetical protein
MTMASCHRGGWAALLSLTAVFVVSFSGPAAAATPEKVTIDGPGLDRRVTITRPEDLIAIIGGLCSDNRAGHPAGRPSLNITIAWTSDLIWRGKLYPPVAGHRFAVDIRDWKLYTSERPSPRPCDRRVVGSEALDVLRRYDVPTILTPREPAIGPSLGLIRTRQGTHGLRFFGHVVL